jgi:hypothetical protein
MRAYSMADRTPARHPYDQAYLHGYHDGGRYAQPHMDHYVPRTAGIESYRRRAYLAGFQARSGGSILANATGRAANGPCETG